MHKAGISFLGRLLSRVQSLSIRVELFHFALNIYDSEAGTVSSFLYSYRSDDLLAFAKAACLTLSIHMHGSLSLAKCDSTDYSMKSVKIISN